MNRIRKTYHTHNISLSVHTDGWFFDVWYIMRYFMFIIKFKVKIISTWCVINHELYSMFLNTICSLMPHEKKNLSKINLFLLQLRESKFRLNFLFYLFLVWYTRIYFWWWYTKKERKLCWRREKTVGGRKECWIC